MPNGVKFGLPRFEQYPQPQPVTGLLSGLQTGLQTGMGLLSEVEKRKEQERLRIEEERKRKIFEPFLIKQKEAESEEAAAKARMTAQTAREFALLAPEREKEALEKINEQIAIAKANELKSMEYSVLAPFRQRKARYELEQLAEYTSDLGKLAQDEQLARAQGNTAAAEDLKKARESYSQIKQINRQASTTGKMLAEREAARLAGNTEAVQQYDAELAAKAKKEETLSPQEKIAYTQEMNDFSAFRKEAINEAMIGQQTINRVKSFNYNYRKASKAAKGWRLQIPIYGKKLEKSHLSPYLSQMTKDVAWLQTDMMRKIKSGRMTMKLQDLIKSANLDPGLHPIAVKGISDQYLAAGYLYKLRLKFIDAAKKRGVTDPGTIQVAWGNYVQNEPIIDQEKRVHPEVLNDNVWMKYLPKRGERLSDKVVGGGKPVEKTTPVVQYYSAALEKPVTTKRITELADATDLSEDDVRRLLEIK